jgi:preprotein translocase subunit SecD
MAETLPSSGLTPVYAQESANASGVRQQLIAHLRELVEALDRRVPQLQREGETRIAREAAALKQQALERIAELETR